MRFERGQDPKEAIRVGKAGDALKIDYLKIVSPFEGDQMAQHQYPISGDRVIDILSNSKHAIPKITTDLNTGDYSIFVEYIDDNRNKKEELLENFRGKYLEYKGQIFPILFPLEISMNIKFEL